MHPLNGAFLKLRRAQYHLEALQEAIQQWKDSKPYDLVLVHENNTLNYIGLAKERVPIPKQFSLIAGDICCNLRSVLDYTLWQLWLQVVPTFSKNVYFPICDSPSDFQKKATANIKGLPQCQQELVEKLQPYKTGDKALAVLRDLNNGDKHRMINIFAAIAQWQSFEIEGASGRPTTGGITYKLAERVEVKDGAVLLKLACDPSLAGSQMKVNAEFSMSVTFKGSKSADGLLIDSALKQSLSAVHNALLQFESEFPGASTEKVQSS